MGSSTIYYADRRWYYSVKSLTTHAEGVVVVVRCSLIYSTEQKKTQKNQKSRPARMVPTDQIILREILFSIVLIVPLRVPLCSQNVGNI